MSSPTPQVAAPVAAPVAQPLAPAPRQRTRPSPSAGPSLSPSRASDFVQCPLLYRFRVVDKLPEPPSPAAVRGTVVHSVLERLFDLPAAQRTPAAAAELLAPQWQELRESEPELAELFDDAAEQQWLASAGELIERWFTLEDPTRLEPAERELLVEVDLESGLRLRGYVDRLDVSPAGDLRVVDYKTGRSPREAFEAKALFQMRFYALVLWRLRGVVPAMLQLVYLGDGQVLRYSPSEPELVATERKVEALWQAIARATETGDWRPRQSRLCAWCAHQSLCPLFGGTPPPLPGTTGRAGGAAGQAGATAVLPSADPVAAAAGPGSPSV